MSFWWFDGLLRFILGAIKESTKSSFVGVILVFAHRSPPCLEFAETIGVLPVQNNGLADVFAGLVVIQ